jgi:hypothetical protein
MPICGRLIPSPQRRGPRERDKTMTITLDKPVDKPTRYLVEAVDATKQWSSHVGHYSFGLENALTFTLKDYMHTFNAEDNAYLLDWAKGMVELAREGWHSDMSCSIEIDGCTFSISDISDSNH